VWLFLSKKKISQSTLERKNESLEKVTASPKMKAKKKPSEAHIQPIPPTVAAYPLTRSKDMRGA
jgi:hypothetical protein